MSHKQQIEFISLVKENFPDFFEAKKILEVGSLDLNGSIRSFFSSNCEYTGVDLEIGKGVDLAVPGQLLDLSSRSFDLTLSCECFEHNPFWVETFINMLRMTKQGGLVIMSCACYGRAEHGTKNSCPQASPFTVNQDWDYYCNLSSFDFEKKLNLNNWFSLYRFYYKYKSHDLYFVGIIKNPEESRNYVPQLNAIAEKYQTLQDIYYEKMCFLGRDVFQNLKLDRFLNPGGGTSKRLSRIFKKVK
jgi:SAM-dependent methyltransferase